NEETVTPQKGLIPANVHPNDIVRERDLAALVGRILRQTSSQTETPLTSLRPADPVNRLRALTALVKVFVSPDNIASFRSAPPDAMPPDTAQIPTWGLPYAAAAVEMAWWPTDRPLRPREAATWAFVEALLSRMPLSNDDTVPVRRAPESRARTESLARPDADAYTGLLVDARDFRLQRT